MRVSRESHRAYRHNTLWFARCNAKVYIPGCYQHTQVYNHACQPIRNTSIQSHITGRCFPCIASCVLSQRIVVRTKQCQGVRIRMLPTRPGIQNVPCQSLEQHRHVNPKPQNMRFPRVASFVLSCTSPGEYCHIALLVPAHFIVQCVGVANIFLPAAQCNRRSKNGQPGARRSEWQWQRSA